MRDIKQEREALRLTQQDVAVMLGTSRVTYIKWEGNLDTMPLGKFNYLVTEFDRLNKLKQAQ